MLALYDCQEGRIDDLVEILEGLLGYIEAINQGFQYRKSLLQQSTDSIDTFSYDKLSIHEQDSFIRALVKVLDKNGDFQGEEKNILLSWNTVERLVKREGQTSNNLDESVECETLNEMQRIYHDLHQELLKHSKTETQVLLVPEKLYDLQRKFREITQRLQPILQKASQVY
jgi:anion-transporting  ArsA/GET3 family ATPase